jgi:hypothetical protein
MSDQKNLTARQADGGPEVPPDVTGRRSKFGAAADGWEAYNSWLDRVRQQPGDVASGRHRRALQSVELQAGPTRPGAFDKPK